MSENCIYISREPFAETLLIKHFKAYLLLLQIACDAKDNSILPLNGLEYKETILKSATNYNLTQTQFHSAKRILIKNGQITLRETDLGTIAKLTDSCVYQFTIDLK